MTANRPPRNSDEGTIDGFGDEWTRYDQSSLLGAEREEIFGLYFARFPWDRLPKDAEGFDLGCGTGRWARLVAPRVGRLHCIDASPAALDVARRNLQGLSNCQFHVATVDAMPLADGTMDFGYCLGVLHHVPDTAAGIRSCVDKLKPGAPLLLYLYYAFDNRPLWFRGVWSVSNWMRLGIARLPYRARYRVTQLLAAFVYFPAARLAGLLEKLGHPVGHFPLSFYRNRSFYTMRTDALDRFGTRLERRFTAKEIRDMLTRAGVESIEFNREPPYWCVVGVKGGVSASKPSIAENQATNK